MYGELLALVFIEMADAQVLADQANSLPDRQREEVKAQLTHNFIDPMLKYFDLVDASLLVDALLSHRGTLYSYYITLSVSSCQSGVYVVHGVHGV